jgi:glycosyltransferase involved in cell wall biosynthesis
MKVAFFQHAFCTRAIKEAIALKPRVTRLIGLTTRPKAKATRPTQAKAIQNGFDEIYAGIDSYESILEIYAKEKFDIIHCHNFPDIQATLAIKARDKADNRFKVVHDIHDHGTLQYQDLTDEQKAEEQLAEKNSDGIVFVSQQAKEKISKDRQLSQPSTVIYSKPNRDFFPNINGFLPNAKIFSDADQPVGQRRLRFVYQGGIDSKPGHHRNYLNQFKEIARHGFELHIFAAIKPNNPEHLKICNDYKALDPENIFVYPPLELQKLYETLTGFDAGISILAGNAAPYQHLTIPNKIFEYAACGIPSIVDTQSQAIQDYVEKNKMGLVISSWKDFDPNDLTEVKAYLIQHRDIFCMEQEIPKLMALYRQILTS